MTAQRFMARVEEILDSFGYPVPSAPGEWETFLNESLQEFTCLAPCLFSDNVAVTLTSSFLATGVADFRDTSVFALKMHLIRTFAINNNMLQDFDGRQKPVRVGDLSRFYPNYQTQPTALPQFYAMIAPSQVRLFPRPDQAYTQNYVSGFYIHPDVDMLDGSSTDTILVPQEFTEDACKYAARRCMAGVASGDDDYKRIQVITNELAPRMAALLKLSNAEVEDAAPRGYRARPTTFIASRGNF